MAEERNLGLARARETSSGRGAEEPNKEELQHRMEEARDAITNTVTEIKENVAQQVETVKDALDWREHFKKQPLGWSLGAAGVGFFVGYGISAAFSGDPKNEINYASSTYSAAAQSVSREALDGKHDGPGMLERFRETSAYDRLSKEAGAIGDRLVEELSTTAQAVVLPALLKKVKGWIGLDLADKARPSENNVRSSSYEPALRRTSES